MVSNTYIMINLPLIENFKHHDNIESAGKVLKKIYGENEKEEYDNKKYENEKEEYDENGKENKIINKDYKKLFIYSVNSLPISIENFNFSNKMTELYLWDEYFDANLINLPENLLLLSICSSLFDTNLKNLPDGLEYLYINSNCFNKNLTNLPIGLKVLSITIKNLNIKLDNLP